MAFVNGVPAVTAGIGAAEFTVNFPSALIVKESIEFWSACC